MVKKGGLEKNLTVPYLSLKKKPFCIRYLNVFQLTNALLKFEDGYGSWSGRSLNTDQIQIRNRSTAFSKCKFFFCNSEFHFFKIFLDCRWDSFFLETLGPNSTLFSSCLETGRIERRRYTPVTYFLFPFFLKTLQLCFLNRAQISVAYCSGPPFDVWRLRLLLRHLL